MPAKDQIHDVVKYALVKDGWTITHDPFPIEYEDKYVYADLAAERPFAAQRGNEKIIVEIKSFVGYSVVHDFKLMLGQYMLYQSLLGEVAPEYKLFVAVDDTTYDNDFQMGILRRALSINHVPLIVIDLEAEEIIKWIQ
jgi:hypothetical protein